MDTGNKILLGDYVKRELTSKYGSVAAASEMLGFSYDRLKKMCSRNTFNVDDIKVLFPEDSFETVQERFSFKRGRASNKNRKWSQGGGTINSAKFLGLLFGEKLDKDDIAFIRENRAVAERLTNLVHKECIRLRSLFN